MTATASQPSRRHAQESILVGVESLPQFLLIVWLALIEDVEAFANPALDDDVRDVSHHATIGTGEGTPARHLVVRGLVGIQVRLDVLGALTDELVSLQTP